MILFIAILLIVVVRRTLTRNYVTSDNVTLFYGSHCEVLGVPQSAIDAARVRRVRRRSELF